MKTAMSGLAMIIAMPYAVYAQDSAVEGPAQFSSSYSPYLSHYGADGSKHPLMDHLSVPAVLPPSSSGWRLEFGPAPTASKADDPLTPKKMVIGIRRDF